MMLHSAPEAVRIAEKVFPIIVAVLLHSRQEPCHRLHKRIIVHDGVPFISLQPVARISVMLRQNDSLRVRFLYCLAELLPEIVVVLLTVSEIRRNVQSPAIGIERR